LAYSSKLPDGPSRKQVSGAGILPAFRAQAGKMPAPLSGNSLKIPSPVSETSLPLTAKEGVHADGARERHPNLSFYGQIVVFLTPHAHQTGHFFETAKNTCSAETNVHSNAYQAQDQYFTIICDDPVNFSVFHWHSRCL
jgi:hypothetical protein